MSVQDRIEACKSHAREREAEGKRADSLWEACEIAEALLARAERAEATLATIADQLDQLHPRIERAERIVEAVEALIPKWQRRYEREAGGFDIAGSVAATTLTCLNELNDALNTQERT